MKNLDRAILLVLLAMPRPVPETVVLARLGEVYSGHATLDEVGDGLERLVATGDVERQSKRLLGLLYAITDSGKEAVA